MSEITQEEFDDLWSRDALRYPEYIDDTRRVQDVIGKHLGVSLTLHQAETIWSDYSEGWAAAWLTCTAEIDIINAFDVWVRRARARE